MTDDAGSPLREKTAKLLLEEQIQLLTRHLRGVEAKLSSQHSKIAEMEQELLLYRADQDSLANRCKALETRNHALLLKNQSLSKTVGQLSETLVNSGLCDRALAEETDDQS